MLITALDTPVVVPLIGMTAEMGLRQVMREEPLPLHFINTSAWTGISSRGAIEVR
jgi:hypothetical protein